jgi:hypothetical protein
LLVQQLAFAKSALSEFSVRNLFNHANEVLRLIVLIAHQRSLEFTPYY